MYERIVVGTDGSERAADAVRAAGRIASMCGLSAVHVVSACPTMSSYEVARIQAGLPEEFRDVVSPALEAQSHLSEARTLLAPVVMTPHERRGDPADAILAVAESVKADLVVVGARGLGTVERFLRGSVSTKVAHHSQCDVLIVEHDT